MNQIWSINHKLNNPDILRYISTFILYKPIKRDIMRNKIKNKEFEDMKDGYGSIENWNVYNVQDMSSMFYNCLNFNQNLSKWNVQNITDIKNMFYSCKKLIEIPNWK